MGILKRVFDGRGGMFYAELAAALVAAVCAVYYAVQSNIDGCFSLLYFLLMLGGILAIAVHCFVRLDLLTPVSGALFGAAFGVMLYCMLPSLSDVWNGVNFIGGNLTAYIVYTAMTLVSAVAVIVCCFAGTEKEG